MRKAPIGKGLTCWVAVVLALAACDDDSASGGDDAGPDDELTQLLIADLEQEGFRVSQGAPVLYQARRL